MAEREMEIGTWVRFKGHALMSGSRHGRLIGRDGDLYYFETDGSTDACAVRSDFIVPVEQQAPHDVFPMRKTLPYGVYICADGSRVLHNRDYEPIVRINADGSRSNCSPDERIQHVSQEWFYGPDTPWENAATERLCRSILAG